MVAPTIGRPRRSRYTCHEVTAARAGQILSNFSRQCRLSQRRDEKSMKMLAARSATLMAKALITQLSSMRPLSMNLSSKARTRTRTAASAKNEEQRGAAMAMKSKSGEGFVWGGAPLPGGTNAIRLVGWGEEAGICCGETLPREVSTFL